MEAHNGLVKTSFATLDDLDWILQAIPTKWDEITSQSSRYLQPHRWIPSSEDLSSSIASQLVLLAHINDEKVGYLIFMQNDQCHFGVGYGEWFNPFLYIIDAYTVPGHRRRGVYKSLYQMFENIAKSRKITEIMTHGYFACSTPVNVAESVGFKPQVAIFMQTLNDYDASLPKINEKYSNRWDSWTTRDATADEASYLVAGLADIYCLEGYADKTDDMSEQYQQAQEFIAKKHAFIAVDRQSNERLGLLTFAIGKQFPYGCDRFGEFPTSFLWCSYVWVEPHMRSSGVARYLYHELFQRARSLGASIVGLDVFNRNEGSWTFHEKALSFIPEVQVFNKLL